LIIADLSKKIFSISSESYRSITIRIAKSVIKTDVFLYMASFNGNFGVSTGVVNYSLRAGPRNMYVNTLFGDKIVTFDTSNPDYDDITFTFNGNNWSKVTIVASSFFDYTIIRL